MDNLYAASSKAGGVKLSNQVGKPSSSYKPKLDSRPAALLNTKRMNAEEILNAVSSSSDDEANSEVQKMVNERLWE